MRSPVLAFASLAAALALGACGDGGPCQDLGERLCKCAPAGITKESCVQGVKTEVKNLNPNGAEDGACRKALGTCSARQNPDTGETMDFCDWLSGRCGKSACGISEEKYDTLVSDGVCQ